MTESNRPFDLMVVLPKESSESGEIEYEYYKIPSSLLEQAQVMTEPEQVYRDLVAKDVRMAHIPWPDGRAEGFFGTFLVNLASFRRRPPKKE